MFLKLHKQNESQAQSTTVTLVIPIHIRNRSFTLFCSSGNHDQENIISIVCNTSKLHSGIHTLLKHIFGIGSFWSTAGLQSKIFQPL